MLFGEFYPIDMSVCGCLHYYNYYVKYPGMGVFYKMNMKSSSGL